MVTQTKMLLNFHSEEEFDFEYTNDCRIRCRRCEPFCPHATFLAASTGCRGQRAIKTCYCSTPLCTRVCFNKSNQQPAEREPAANNKQTKTTADSRSNFTVRAACGCRRARRDRTRQRCRDAPASVCWFSSCHCQRTRVSGRVRQRTRAVALEKNKHTYLVPGECRIGVHDLRVCQPHVAGQRRSDLFFTTRKWSSVKTKGNIFTVQSRVAEALTEENRSPVRRKPKRRICKSATRQHDKSCTQY